VKFLPEVRKRIFYTTARIIHADTDWLWVNPSRSHEYNDWEDAKRLEELSNHNGNENGLDIGNYPYFVVKVIQTNEIDLERNT
jgi:hypothetical protein